MVPERRAPTLAAHSRRRLKFIGCEIIYREACWLAATSPELVDVEFLRKGLHAPAGKI